MTNLNAFLEESLRIEGITRPPLLPEIEAVTDFLKLPRLDVAEVSKLVLVFQPNACLRNRSGLNVRVGNHKPPCGGPKIPQRLERILDDANLGQDMWRIHCQYESLHPYTDGNGRSGRAIWLWQWQRMHRDIPRSFLHQAYYQALAAYR